MSRIPAHSQQLFPGRPLFGVRSDATSGAHSAPYADPPAEPPTASPHAPAYGDPNASGHIIGDNPLSIAPDSSGTATADWPKDSVGEGDEPLEKTMSRNQSEPRSARLIRLRMLHKVLGLIEANIRNISAHGLGGVTDTQLSVGDRLDLCLKDGKSMRAEVRWTRQEGKRTAFGLRSEGVLQPASFAAKGDGKDWDRTVIKPLDENHVFARYRPMKTAKRPGFGRRI